ncbi:MAG: hypothetical protein EAZ39_16140 [Oscillatoriales cyanobacterium]|nr:MAG: hypothetical protein EAZ39_16140 [Oscillatoriales cyanobacterium]
MLESRKPFKEKLKSDVNCQLSTVNCQLSTVNCQLSTVNCQLSTVNCQLILPLAQREHLTGESS